MATEIDIDDDFGLRDEDFMVDTKTTDESKGQDTEEVMEVDDSNAEKSQMRDNVIFVQGVDDLSTKDVQQYILEYLPKEDFRIDWINDTSVNVVFPEHETAQNALTNLTSEAVYYDGDSYSPTTLRDAKTHPTKRTAKLQIRFALETDKKERNSREKSKYYLFHGEPTYEDERFRYTHANPRSKRGEASENEVAKQYGYHPATEQDDLFPNKLIDQPEVQGGEQADDGDLFPDKLKSQRTSSSNSYRSRNQSSARTNRARSRSPGKKPGSSLGSRLGPKVSERSVKGEALSDRIDDFPSKRNRKNRRRAADLF